MADKLTSIPSIDPAHIMRPHVPLELEISWIANYTGTGLDPGEPVEIPGVPISLEGGTGPSGSTLASLPAMAGLPISDGGDPPALDHTEVDAWHVDFHFEKHHIPAKIVATRTEVDADDVESITTTDIIIKPSDPSPGEDFTASTPGSLDEAFSCGVAFGDVYAPWLTA